MQSTTVYCQGAGVCGAVIFHSFSVEIVNITYCELQWNKYRLDEIEQRMKDGHCLSE